MLILRARRVFDGRDLTAKRAVVVSDGKIVELLDDAPESGDVRDLGDVTLLPGLVDTHVHLAFDASPDPVAALDAPGLLDRMRAAAHAHLAVGVTTVRDLGDRDYLALRLARRDDRRAGDPQRRSPDHLGPGTLLVPRRRGRRGRRGAQGRTGTGRQGRPRGQDDDHRRRDDARDLLPPQPVQPGGDRGGGRRGAPPRAADRRARPQRAGHLRPPSRPGSTRSSTSPS